MFTGLVEGMGEIVRVIPGSGETRLAVRALFPVETWVRGESVAINGACLSVETFNGPEFTAYASAETLRLTNLGALAAGGRVNLERALSFGARLGGHLVSGHVDAQAVLESITPAGSSLRLRVRFPEEFFPQVIVKGSVALDGVSLTVNHCGSDFLEVNVIPDTSGTTTIGAWRPGRKLNFETDLIGKYVQRMLAAWSAHKDDSRLTMDFLRDNGF